MIAPLMAAEAAAGHGAEHGGGGIEIGQHWTETLPGWGTFHADTVLYAGLVMGVLLLVFAGLATAVNKVPDQQSGHTGTVLEGIVDFVQGFIHDFIGPDSSPYLWYIGSIFVFVLTCNWLALLPWKAWEMWAGGPLAHLFGAPHPLVYEAPTADLNLTLGMALCTLVLYWYFGIKHNGIGGFLGHHWFAKPWPLFPLRMLEDITRPASLALRLFANMTAGHVIGMVLLLLTVFVIPSILLPLELFVGAVQAFVFAVLSASYIGTAAARHGDHH
ncbi:MAG: synthase subcomplex subunit [Cyanobacteria bacterium RYN_339]|nr:synthase subcomplex subunit [Cyanobacteria bacterium RYN_339]